MSPSRAVALVLALLAAPACDKHEADRGPQPTPVPEADDGSQEAAEPELVDLYGDPLPDGAALRLGSVRMLDRALGRLIFSADGSEIITSSEDAYLIWQTTTAQRVGSLVRENGGHAMAVSPDGKLLATAVYGGEIQLWDYPKRQALGVLEGHRSDVSDLCFAGDHILVSGSADRTVKLWERTDEIAEKATLDGDWEKITGVACSPESVVFADDQGAVYLAPTHGDKIEPKKLGEAEEAVLDVAVSADGKRVAAGVADGSVLLWRATRPGKPRVIEEAHARKVLSVVFTAKGELMTSGGDRFFRTWNPETGEKTGEREAASEIDAQLFELSKDGAFVAAYTELRDGRASEAGRFWLYDNASGKQLLEPDRHQAAVTAVAFTAKGDQVVTASEDHTVKLWNAKTSSLVRTLSQQKGPVRDLQLFGNKVFSAGDDARMHVASLSGGDHIILEPIGGAVHALAVSPGGDRVVTGDFVGQLWSFSTKSGKKIARHGNDDLGQIYDLAFSPDGKYFAVAAANRHIHIVSVASGKTLTKLSPEGLRSQHAVAFSPDGKLLASGGDDNMVRLWDTATWAPKRVLEGLDGTVRSVAFSADGSRVAAGSSDQSARVWEVATGREITLLVGHRGAVTGVAFSPDGTRLATASRDQTALIWKLPEEEAAKPEKAAAKPDAAAEPAKAPDAGAEAAKAKPDAGK